MNLPKVEHTSNLHINWHHGSLPSVKENLWRNGGKILKGVLMIGVIRGHDQLHIIALINFR